MPSNHLVPYVFEPRQTKECTDVEKAQRLDTDGHMLIFGQDTDQAPTPGESATLIKYVTKSLLTFHDKVCI